MRIACPNAAMYAALELMEVRDCLVWDMAPGKTAHNYQSILCRFNLEFTGHIRALAHGRRLFFVRVE